MSDDHGINDHDSSGEQPTVPQGPPKLRPHLVVTRTITYRGDAESIKALLDHSLPEGLFLAGNAAFTIEVETAPIKQQEPEWLGVIKAELGEKEKRAVEAAQRKGSPILNPHTLRPVK